MRNSIPNFQNTYAKGAFIGGAILLFLVIIVIASKTNTEQVGLSNEYDAVRSSTYTIEDPLDYLILELNGTLHAKKDVTIASEMKGVLSTLTVEAGDTVRQGTLIAIVDHDEIDTQLSTAYATYEQIQAYAQAGSDNAQTSLDTSRVVKNAEMIRARESLNNAIENGISQGFTTASNARKTLIVLSDVQSAEPSNGNYYSESLVAGYKEQAILQIFDRDGAGYFGSPYIAEMTGGLYAYFQNVDIQQVVLPQDVIVQLENLHAGLSVTKKAFDEIRPAVHKESSLNAEYFEEAAGGIDADMSTLMLSIQSIKEAIRELEQTSLVQDSKVYDNEVALQSTQHKSAADVTLARQKIEELETIKRNAYIYAPITGVVSERYVSRGEMVHLGESVVSIVDTSTWKIELSVSDEYNKYIYRGAKVEVRIDGVANVFTGSIERIIPRVDEESRRIRFDVALDQLPKTARDGLFARVSLAVPVQEIYAVPSRFVSYGYDGPEVRTEDQSIPVTVVRDEGESVYISANELEAGLKIK